MRWKDEGIPSTPSPFLFTSKAGISSNIKQFQFALPRPSFLLRKSECIKELTQPSTSFPKRREGEQKFYHSKWSVGIKENRAPHPVPQRYLTHR